MKIETKIKSIRLYKNDVEKIRSKNLNTSKFLRYTENRYIKALNTNSKELLKLYDLYIKNYQKENTEIITYNGITTNKIYTRKYLTAYIHYNLNKLLKNYKEI